MRQSSRVSRLGELKYEDIPVILTETKTSETKTFISDLLEKVKRYQSQIKDRIDAFFKKMVPGKISKEFSQIFWDAVDSDKSLTATLRDLRALYMSIPPKTPATKGRGASRIRQIQRWLNPLKRKRGFNYLDVGCSEGALTESVGDALGLKKGKVYGCDVSLSETPEGKAIFSKSSPTSLPYEDNEFDLVTTFQALHHFTHPHVMLSEIHRVLKPGGVYIIREHDSRTPEFGVYMDVVHALYATVFNSEESPESFVENYQSFYHTKEEWSHDYIVTAGFKFGGLYKTNDRFNSYYARYFRV